jgi:hypothetical protein
MSITYCSRLSCGKLSCDYHQYNAPKNKDISIADRNIGCWGLYENPNHFYYCGYSDCIKKGCRFHLDRAPKGVAVEVIYKDDGCYERPSEKRESLLKAICQATQVTGCKCDEVCRAMCGNDGICHFCATIADAVEEVFK